MKNSFPRLWFWITLSLVSASGSSAETYTFEEYKCRITIPDKGWVLDTTIQAVRSSRVLLVAQTDSSDHWVTLVVDDVPLDVDIRNEEFINKFKQEVAEKTTIVSESYGRLAGLDAFQLTALLKIQGAECQMRMTTVIANKHVYTLNTMTLEATGERGEEADQIVQSFQFIGEPILHKSGGVGGGLSPERVGYLTGTAFFYLLFIGVPAFFIFRKISRTRRLEREQKDDTNV